MFALVPLSVFVILFLISHNSFNLVGGIRDWRNSFLAASLAWGLLATVFTELLSFFELLSFEYLLGLWAAALLLLILTLFKLGQNRKALVLPSGLSGLSGFSIVCLFCVAAIVMILAITALVSPPNNWDSMTYHTARVAHWVQNQSVFHYPTHIERQLAYNPWAEFAILNWQILSHGDRLSNLIQWFSMVGCLVGVSLIGKLLGAGARGQILATVVGAAIPMGILQSSSTQNDYVVSFWLTCLVCFILLSVKNGMSTTLSLMIGGSLGLAVLTKGTAYFYAIPLLVWLLVSEFKRNGRKLLKCSLIIAILVLSINIGHFARNFDLYNSPIARTGYLMNESYGPLSLTSNVTRNLGLHLTTPFHPANRLIEGGIHRLHAYLGVSIVDARTTFQSIRFSNTRASDTLRHEDFAPNTIHLLLISFCSIYIIFNKKLGSWSPGISYVLALTFAFLLFCAVLKWQPSHSRLHLPFFVLWAPVIGFVLSQIAHRKLVTGLVILLLLLSLPFLFRNQTRPLVGIHNIFSVSRDAQYLNSRPHLSPHYLQTVKYLQSLPCSEVGLILRGDTGDYPFWALLESRGGLPRRIEHVDVTNASSIKYRHDSLNEFRPCAIISTKPPEKETLVTRYGNYIRSRSSGPISVFVRE